ncbi:PucR family transcriptional regulator [Nonomuraea sp. NPDC050790]|uniref:PucR family transcriptional regulator n=1 Tax=Nonomuraea sp. NPDC050790 TaxID=3364371 RepID=UPI0037BA2772
MPDLPLARVLEALGSTLLDVVCGDLARAVGGVVIHDPLDEPELPDNALVLGVGLREPAEIARVVTELGERGAVGLVVRGPVVADEALPEAARAAGVAVLALARGASWTHLAETLRALTRDGAGLGRIRSGDLFAVAGAISALLDAPVTIEDRHSRVLAFSNRQEEADPSRVRTILGRQVPRDYTEILEERGVFQAIYRSGRPVFVAPLPETGELPRAAVAVRAGDEILGTIWVVVPEPLDEERGAALYEASKLVAMHMVWQRADEDRERRLRADLLTAALAGGPGASEAVRRLGLKDEPAVVLALTVAAPASQPPPPAHLAAERGRLADAFALHLSAAHPRAVVALIDDIAYGILPLPHNGQEAEERAAQIAADFLTRITPRPQPEPNPLTHAAPGPLTAAGAAPPAPAGPGPSATAGVGSLALVGVGPLAPDSSALDRSRSGAERALRVLRAGVLPGRRVARLDDVHVDALLLELADRIPRGDLPSGALARVAAYDAEHQTSLVETLRCWLEAFGDVVAAASAMYVHPNTFRYRLRRAAEVGGLDLTDPAARLSAMLQLRLISIRSAPES